MAGLAGPWYVSWAWFVVPLVAVFAIAGSVSGSVAPVSRRVFWRVVVVLNVLFLVWTALTWMQFAGVFDWRAGRYLLIGATALGIAFHFGWWLIANLLLAIGWWTARLTQHPHSQQRQRTAG